MGIEAILSFGGNMGNVQAGFRSARERLACTKGIKILDSSCIYCSPPWGCPAEQPDYLNAIVLLDVDMGAEMLLQHMQHIEKQLGRVRTGERWGPRTLDLDLIAYDDTVMHTTQLTLPHPHMHERMLVLQPLCDIRPDWRHPVLKQTAKTLLASMMDAGIPRLEEKQIW